MAPTSEQNRLIEMQIRMTEQQIEANMKLVETLAQLNTKLSNGPLKEIALCVQDNKKKINTQTILMTGVIIQLTVMLLKVMF